MSPDTSMSLPEMLSDFVFIAANIGVHHALIPSGPVADAELGGSKTALLAAVLTIAAQSLLRYDPSRTSWAFATASLSASAFAAAAGLAVSVAPVLAGVDVVHATRSRSDITPREARVSIMSASGRE